MKASGEVTDFSSDKLKESLVRSGADARTVNSIIETVERELYQGISTKEIYNRAFVLLKKHKSIYASKYKLKRAIYELGPTGFPFERFIAAVLKYSGYEVSVGEIMQGKCVTHEIDVIAKKALFHWFYTEDWFIFVILLANCHHLYSSGYNSEEDIIY